MDLPTGCATTPRLKMRPIDGPPSSPGLHHKYAPSRSTGVWAVTVDEVLEVERHVIDDSAAPLAEGERRAPGPCFVNYRQPAKPDTKSNR